MEEIVISVIAERIFKEISSLALSEISLAWGFEKELEKLKHTFSTIEAELSDAEEHQTKINGVKDYLEKLKDVFYDMDDMLDECSTEALRRQVEIHGSKLKKVRKFLPSFAFRLETRRAINNIRERLHNIASDRINFHLPRQVENAQVKNPVGDSFVLPPNVIGRTDDKVKLVELLLSFRDRKALSVIPIVGLGGLGKTTLAKLVYNDDEVGEIFEMKMWVCVSEEFDLGKVLKKIIKSATGANVDGSDEQELQNCLPEILNAKKFLLVLDDVWNEDYKRWTDLEQLLQGGANGSTVIITTRSMRTASIMGTIPFHNLNELSYDDCLSLFMRWAFKGHETEHPGLVEIGKQIVHKCGGVPLAVETLGSQLYMKTDSRQWEIIRDSDIWKLKQDSILPALRLSYERIPSYLKHCFLCCSMFPKDYIIGREELIEIWIALGLIHASDDNRQMEDIGNQYFKELISRLFFQNVIEDYDFEMSRCRIHCLVNDLAQKMVGSECLKVDLNSKINISEKVRHLVITRYDFSDKEVPTFLLAAVKLRSLRFSCNVGSISKAFLDKIISCFRRLRVLDFRDSMFEKLPRFVCKLKHLRYLNLSGNSSLKALPNSICKLLNLQTLVLHNCQQLQDLPRDIGKLINLRHLYLTSQQVCLPDEGLRGLTSLQSLRLYRCNLLASLSEGIQHLTSLRTLHIRECQSITSLPSCMGNLTALEDLGIWDCRELNLLQGEGIQGLKCLRSLTIVGLPKLVALPQNLQDSAATLQYSCICNCKGLTTLPEWLHVFTSLQRLYIMDCPILSSLPEGIKQLTALQKLVIRGCPHLSRKFKKAGQDWPRISHIADTLIA